MPRQEVPQKQRISGSYGRTMILVGVFFDLIPVLMVALAILLVAYGLTETYSTLIDASVAAKTNCTKWELLYKPVYCGVVGLVRYANLGVQVGIVVVSSVGAGVFVGPALYVFGSYLSVFTAYLFFTLWFLFKGVNIWSFSNTKRVLVNISSMVVENVPGLNLLPGITVMVWRHVKMSQMEDRVENASALQSASRTMHAAKVSR